MQVNQVALTANVANELQQFTQKLEYSYNLLVKGDEFSGVVQLPHEIVAEALEYRSGIICKLLYSYIKYRPDVHVLPLLDSIIKCWNRVLEIAEEVARQLKLVVRKGLSYVNRFSIAPERLFALGYIEKTSARFSSPQRACERMMEWCCRTVRDFLSWLRQGLRQLKDIIHSDPFRKIVLTPYASGVVEIIDRRMGLVVLKATPRLGSRPFSIRPNSTKAWEVLRRLCEACDDEGYVMLPTNYASSFHHTDANNDTVNDDYERLLRHIVPGLKPGCYRLELNEKPRLLRDR